MTKPSRRRSTVLGTVVLLACLAPSAGAQSPSAATELPTATEILGRYVQALGGEEAIRRHESVFWRGSIEMPGADLSGPLEVWAAAPNLSLIRFEAPGLGEVAQGFDGTVGWATNLMTGPQLLEGPELEVAALQSDYWADLRYQEHYPTMEVVARESFADEQTYKLRLVTADGRESFHYFAVDSGLLIGLEGQQPTPMGEIWVSTRIGRYREYDGRLYPTEQRLSVVGSEQVLRFDEVELGGVEPSRFSLPEAIRALVESQAPEE
jgi:hypothetical protein